MHLLEPEALGKLSTELAEQANAWSLILPRSVLSCELLKSLDVSFVALKFRLFSLKTPISFGELRISFDWNEIKKEREKVNHEHRQDVGGDFVATQ